MIKEELLHFLWKSHRIPKFGLKTTQGESVEILSPGILNHNDGPDFSNAKIRIGDVLWVGPVEIHVKSSDWNLHGHQHDSRYESVILHVVLKENHEISTLNRRLPCLEIKQFLTNDLIKKYNNLQSCKENLACSPFEVNNIDESFLWMRDRLIFDRFQRRMQAIKKPMLSNHALFYALICGALGAKANRQAFLDFACKINWPQVNRWQNRRERLLLYFMHLSGLFSKEIASLPEMSLLKEYVPEPMHRNLWKTRQIRPTSQPKKRVLEFSQLILNDVFTAMIESDNPFDYNELWNNIIEDFRSNSYEGLKLSEFTVKNIAINAITPFAYFRGEQTGDDAWFDFALNHLEEWSSEQNKITKLFQNKSLKIKSSGDSQAILELYQNYCTTKKCVSCAIGTSLLRA